MVIVGCDTATDPNPSITSEQIITQDITATPTFFNLSTGLTVETWDLAFTTGTQSYFVDLNQDAGTTVTQGDGAPFDSAAVPGSAYFCSDTGASLAIGDSWMDISTYNPTDHSISGNGMVYFIRSADYQMVKFEILSASPQAFQIRWALENADHSFGAVQNATVNYDSELPAYWDFSSGSAITPENWDFGLVSLPITVPGAGTFYMPSVQLNMARITRVAILPDITLESLTELPDEVDWLEIDGNNQIFGYGGAQEILVYHPEPPYNHKVIVEHPEQLIILETVEGQYKVQFQEYSSGVTLFTYGNL